MGCNSEAPQETKRNVLRALAPSPLAPETNRLVLSPSFVHPRGVSQLLPAPNLILPLNNALQLIQLHLHFENWSACISLPVSINELERQLLCREDVGIPIV